MSGWQNFAADGSLLTAIATIPVHGHTGAGDGGQLNAGSVFSAGQVPLARGGTNADLSATGGTGQYLKQSSAAAAITVGTIADSDLPTTLAGHTLSNTNTITVKDANFTIQDDADTTKQLKIQASGITASTTRTVTAQDADGTMAYTSQIALATGRLCGSATDPIGDSSAVTTLYYTPFTGKVIEVISSSVRKLMTFAATPLSLSGYTANKPYDIWGYDNAGTFALDSTVCTNDSTRATAVVWDSTLGDYVKNADNTRRYMGTIYIDNAGGAVTCNAGARNIWNRHNQIPMLMDAFIGTRGASEYTTTSSTLGNVNSDSTLGSGKIAWVQGLATRCVNFDWQIFTLGNDTAGQTCTAAILLAGAGSGTAAQGINAANASAGIPSSVTIPLIYTPAFGYWTAQKQFKRSANTGRLTELGFIGQFWG